MADTHSKTLKGLETSVLTIATEIGTFRRSVSASLTEIKASQSSEKTRGLSQFKELSKQLKEIETEVLLLTCVKSKIFLQVISNINNNGVSLLTCARFTAVCVC